MVADIEELEEMYVSELHSRRLNAKEVSSPTKGDNFKFRDAYGTVKTPGRDRRLNHPLIRDHLERGEEQEVFRGESDGLSSPTFQDDSTRDDEEAKKDVWSITGDFFSACDLVHHRRSSKWPHARHASVNETSGAPFFSGFWVMS